MNQVIKLDGILSSVQTDEIQIYSSNTLSSLVDQYSKSILSTASFDNTSKVYINVVQPIYLGASLQVVVNDEIQIYSSSTIQELENSFNYSIVSENEFNNSFTYSVTINLNSVNSSSLVENPKLNYVIFLNSSESSTAFESDAKLSTTIYANEIPTSVQFDTSKVNYKIYANSVINSNDFGTADVRHRIRLNSIDPSILFGNARLNQEIDDVPFPSIESTLVIPTPNVLKVIGPLSVAPTANFGTSSFIDNIHRILIFKDDNISKIGENDAAVIAGGIRINPASVVSQTATPGEAELPAAPVGFLSVNINGVDYKIPYYNS